MFQGVLDIEWCCLERYVLLGMYSWGSRGDNVSFFVAHFKASFCLLLSPPICHFYGFVRVLSSKVHPNVIHLLMTMAMLNSIEDQCIFLGRPCSFTKLSCIKIVISIFIWCRVPKDWCLIFLTRQRIGKERLYVDF